MSDASSTSSRSTVTRGHGKRLSEEEIRDLLDDDDAMDDDLDYYPDVDLTQRSDTSEGETEVDDVASVYGTRASPALPRPGSTTLSSPPPCMSPPCLSPDGSLFSDSTCDESFSGFSDMGSDTSSVEEPSTSSGGVTRRGFATSATRRGRRPRASHHGDSRPAPSVVRGRLPIRKSSSLHSIASRSSSGSSRRRRRVGGSLGGSRGGVGANNRAPGVLVWEDCTTFVPEIPSFDDSDYGVTDLFPFTGDDMAEMEYFQAYFDNVFMTHLVTETNRYAHTLIAAGLLPASRLTRWKDTTNEEMYVFLALCMMMKHSEKAALQDYWSKDSLVPSPVFNRYMSRDRYLLILRCLHFENTANEDRHDRLWKVRKMFSDMRGKFRDYFVPGQNVVIDESLVLFKGRLAFKQFIPSKRHRFGLKFFVLCDCETGIVLDMILYSGTDVDIPAQDEHGFSGSVVKTLMEPLLNKGHILFTDNYYTSPLLTRYLLAHNTGVCGTVKGRRREMPVFGMGIPTGECQLRKCDTILSVRWKDRREVNMLTTVHTGAMVDSGKVHFQTHRPMYKPDCVIEYNVNMRLVDKCDMMLGGVECVRKSVRWTKKFFFHLMDVTVLNCYNTYLVKTGRKPSIRVFSAAIVSQLLVKYCKEGSVVPRGVQATMPHAAPDRLRGNQNFAVHMLEYMPGTASRQKGKRACIVCRNTTRREQKRRCISTWCVECKVPLCPVGCFAAYHTLADY